MGRDFCGPERLVGALDESEPSVIGQAGSED